jgi:dynein light chain 4, axonemal
MNEGVWDEEKRKALQKLKTSKVITKMTDMNQDLRVETTEIVTMAVEKYCSVGQYETAARNIKESLDHKYGPSWHCVIGEGFGYEVTYEAKFMLYLVFNTVGIVVYKC